MPSAGWKSRKAYQPEPLPGLSAPTVIPILSSDPESSFPPTEQALDYPRGLLAAGGDLSTTRLVNAYRHGIFPWYSEGQPILWWSPAPRCVLYPYSVHISRRLRRRYNQGRFTLTADRAFDRVIKACAAPRHGQDGTWITEEMCRAYISLHCLGYAHSVEVWLGNDLAGGLYGLALGNVFFAESMFSDHVDASKVALVALCRQLHDWNFSLLDCQISNPHLESMGAVEIERDEFNTHLESTDGPDHWRDEFRSDSRW
jgi:leucyl/phenylalanyl-tRNA--protein transferase